jgi:hypothetical protein
MTQALHEYHKTSDPELLDKIQSFFIQYWVMNNGIICGKQLNLFELSQFLMCDQERIRLHMRDQVLSTKLFDKDRQEEIINSLIGQQIVWAMEDRMAIDGQVRILQASQGNKYTPFVTSEVNRALGMKIQTTGTLTNILKSLQGGGSINIFNQNNVNNQQNNLTLEEAVAIVCEENAKTLDKPKELKYIEERYDVDNPEVFPSVVANQMDTSDRENGILQLDTRHLDQVTDNYKGVLEEFENEHHDIRREIELQIDPNSDDPEMTIYPK